MSIENWGLMTKSQIDATLIEERIAEMISEHNDDPTAHMSDDQSIGIHRVNEILDHKAGAVLADKQTMSEVVVLTNFNSTVGWTPTGDYDNAFFPGIRLGSNYPVSTGTRLTAQEGFCEQVFNLAKDFLLEFSGTITDDSTSTFFCGLSNVDYPASGNILAGFKSINGVMKGVFGKTAFFFESATANIDLSTPHIYRVQYNATEKIVYFYVDGELLDSVDVSSLSGTSTCYFRIDLKESAENYVTVFIYYFKVSRQA